MDVNNPKTQPILRVMAKADDDQVGMSRIAAMLTAAEDSGWYLVPSSVVDALHELVVAFEQSGTGAMRSIAARGRSALDSADL